MLCAAYGCTWTTACSASLIRAMLLVSDFKCTHLSCNSIRIFSAVKKLENSLLKYYLVTAYSNNKTDKISEFFNKMAGELQQQSEWKDWFCKLRFGFAVTLVFTCKSCRLFVLQKRRGVAHICTVLHKAVAGYLLAVATQFPDHHLPVPAAARLRSRRTGGCTHATSTG